MSGRKTYRNYFHINESYFPAVNEDVIKTQPDVWKSYYPHESFIRLLNQTKSVLTNSQRMSIWVEGAYGTGKSHAVLTLKKLLDCSNEELKEYFDKYYSVFGSNDLYNEFYNLKNQQKKILTVHRYGSSDVRNDKILMQSVQESIISALKEQGYTYLGQVGIKQAVINWLSEKNNMNYFENIIQAQEYRLKFGGLGAEAILNQLKNYQEDKAIQELIEKIQIVGEEKGIKPFVLNKEDLQAWILDVIDKNNLKAILFIWDEFSDYFNINKGNLSGFQYLAEISETHPFYFAIVTHKSDIFFENSKDDVKTKINGRFIAPHCSIELPDNMAFVLTAHAMQKVEDKALVEEWDEIVDTLYDLTHDSRTQVLNTAKLGEKELKGVLPIHPYAALVLKHIASAFDSNQRSMFDFIKNDRGEEIKGFQWFIDNYGPEDEEESLLTVDLLWDFFYEKGKDQLAPQIRTILDVYSRINSYNLNKKQKRVLKTILLLQSINEKVGDSVSLFIPNEKNLGLAFEGTDITASNAAALASSLIREQIIFERPMGGSQTKYSALTSSGSIEEIIKEKDRLQKEIRTEKLIEEGEFVNDFKLPKNLEIRYPNVRHLTYENIKLEVARLKSDSESHPTRLYAVYTFARNEDEHERIMNEIQRVFNEGFDKIAFIDYSSTYLNPDLFNHYIDNMANCNYQKGKDAGQAKTYDRNAKEALRRWRIQLKSSYPKVYTSDNRNGTTCNSESEVNIMLKEFDKQYFPNALETHVTVLDTMYFATQLKQGAECGITGEIKGTFRSTNDNTKLEKQFAGVWGVENYWEVKPNELLSKVKIAVNNIIKTNMDKNSRVSISDIYDVLKEEPFGFMPCNLTAFVLGFVLREYADDIYNWSDNLTTSPMSVEKLKEMIDEVIKQQNTPNSKYRDKYIVAMSPQQREFNKCTAYAFKIDEGYCSSVENTRSRIRSQMTTYDFPIWALKYAKFNTVNNKTVIDRIIDLYVELANNIESTRTETDIALEIGDIFLNNESLKDDLKVLLSRENCTTGMNEYLKQYNSGELISLAKSINDTGSFIGEIRKKFSEASNWVWNKNTVDAKINETIVEYKIVEESNKHIVRTSSYKDCLKEWGNKCSQFKVSFNSIKQEVGNLVEFLGMLYQIKRNGCIYDNDKEKFLNNLINKAIDIRNFCENQNQLTLLKKIATLQVDGLSNEDINDIANKFLYDVFASENSEFQMRLEKGIQQYKANMSKYKLLTIWKSKTSTSSPMEWSDKYTMPILCLVPASDQEKARSAFDIINNPTVDKQSIDEAITFIEKANYIDDLSSDSFRNECFKKFILKQFSSLIENVEETKKLIKNSVTIRPYYWFCNPTIEDCVKTIAYKKYINGGSDKVDKMIDVMEADQLKKYLKELVKENMIVGIEIINNKK